MIGGTLIVLIGLQIAFNLRLLQPLERMGATIWGRVAPFAKGLLPVKSMSGAFALGMLWGLLPCGLVYSVLLVAAASATAAHGAAIMLAFGAGTLPAMLLTGIGALQLSRLLSRRGIRATAGLIIMIAGLLTLAWPASLLLPGSPAGHSHIG